jgi:carboxylesterase type B
MNLGIKDIAESFRWVRSNIQYFGGNPKQVTAMGFSAGAISVSALLFANDGTLNLFDQAILLSGGPMPYIESASRVQYINDHLLSLVNCSGQHQLSCLRSLKAETLLEASLQTNAHLKTRFRSVVKTFQVESWCYLKKEWSLLSLSDQIYLNKIFVGLADGMK